MATLSVSMTDLQECSIAPIQWSGSSSVSWDAAAEDKPTLASTGDPVQDAVNEAVSNLGGK